MLKLTTDRQTTDSYSIWGIKDKYPTRENVHANIMIHDF